MQCKQANEHFSDYIERGLDPAMTVSVENHLAACPSCREEMSALRRMWTQLDKAPLVEPPARLRADLLRALDAHLEAEQQTADRRSLGTRWTLRDLFRPRSLAYGAAALVLALSSVELVQSQRAALGPFGMIAHALHLSSGNAKTVPLPAITATHSEWQADPAGGGTLVIALKTASADALTLQTLTYRAELVSGADGGANASNGVTGRFDGAGYATLRLHLPNGISGSQVRLALTFDTSGGTHSAPQEIVVPVQQK